MNKQIQIGDYVEYQPDVRVSKKYNVYDGEKFKKTNKYFSTQTGENTLKWRYIGKDKDGRILLVADKPTDNVLMLQGRKGYSEGPSILNDLCKEIYSSSIGEARSINIDDVNRVLGVRPVGWYWSKKDRKLYNPENLTIGQIVSQKGEPELINNKSPEKETSINEYVADFYFYSGIIHKPSTSEEYKLIFNDLLDVRYWLASHCVQACFGDGYAEFLVRCVYYERVDYCTMFFSYGRAPVGSYFPVRPVVVLNSNIQLGEKVNGVWILKEV